MDLHQLLMLIEPNLASLPECDQMVVQPIIDHANRGEIRAVSAYERATILRLAAESDHGPH